MADVTMTEAELVKAMGDATLTTIGAMIDAFEKEADSLFTGQDIADFLYVKGLRLQGQFQAKIDELELAEAHEAFAESGGFSDE